MPTFHHQSVLDECIGGLSLAEEVVGLNWQRHLSARSVFQPSGSWRVGSYRESSVAGPAVALAGYAVGLHNDHRSYSSGSETTTPSSPKYRRKVSKSFFILRRAAHRMKGSHFTISSRSSDSVTQLDIPLIIELVEVIELATGTKGITFTAPFPVTGLAVNARENPNDRELRHTMALYREALNSNTPIYRFLCFYKIIEASINRWNRLDPQQKISLGPQRKGEWIPAGASRVEMEPWLAALFHVNRNWTMGS